MPSSNVRTEENADNLVIHLRGHLVSEIRLSVKALEKDWNSTMGSEMNIYKGRFDIVFPIRKLSA